MPQIVCDLVPLVTGLNIVSTDVAPVNSMLTSVFAAQIQAGALSFVQGRNANGQVVTFSPFLPSFLNSLQVIEPGEGYIVSVIAPSTLEVCGFAIDPAFRKELHQGINLVAYIPHHAQVRSHLFHYS